MDKLKMQIKVTTLPCGHSEGVMAKMNPETGAWTGKCAQCGSPAGVEVHIETPSGREPPGAEALSGWEPSAGWGEQREGHGQSRLGSARNIG